MNIKIKHYLYTSIDRKHLPKLLLRVFMVLIVLVCVYTSVKYLPLVYVSLSSNLAPLMTALLSYFLLRVPVANIDIIILVVSFIGVAILITGTV